MGHIARGMGAFTAKGVYLTFQAGKNEAQVPYLAEGDMVGQNVRGRERRGEPIKTSCYHTPIITQNTLMRGRIGELFSAAANDGVKSSGSQ